MSTNGSEGQQAPSVFPLRKLGVCSPFPPSQLKSEKSHEEPPPLPPTSRQQLYNTLLVKTAHLVLNIALLQQVKFEIGGIGAGANGMGALSSCFKANPGSHRESRPPFAATLSLISEAPGSSLSTCFYSLLSTIVVLVLCRGYESKENA